MLKDQKTSPEWWLVGDANGLFQPEFQMPTANESRLSCISGELKISVDKYAERFTISGQNTEQGLNMLGLRTSQTIFAAL